MRPGDLPELADRMFTEALHFTSAEYADLQTLADRNGVSVEELIVRTTREVLLARFGGEQRRKGNVLPFERP